MTLDKSIIKQAILTPELKKDVAEIFHHQSISQVGFNGMGEDSIPFEIRGDDNELIGCIVIQYFWGQMHIERLVVEKKYRGNGYGQKLMQYVFEYAKTRGCNLIYVETLSFQALKFYQKLGFEVQFIRSGYIEDISFYYLKKDL